MILDRSECRGSTPELSVRDESLAVGSEPHFQSPSVPKLLKTSVVGEQAGEKASWKAVEAGPHFCARSADQTAQQLNWIMLLASF